MTTVSQMPWQCMVQSSASSSFTVTYLCLWETVVQGLESTKRSGIHPGFDVARRFATTGDQG